MRTEASIPVDEFDEYTMMGDDTGEFTVTVKELRAVFKFCESGNATVTVLFERMSRPIIIDAKIPEVISAEFLLATIVHNADDDYSDGSSEASSSCSSRPSKSSMEGTKATTNSALSSVTSHPPSNLFSPAVSIPGPSINSSLSAPQSGKSLAAALEEGCVMGSDDDNDDDERGENREERGEGKRKRIKLSKSSKARSKPKKPLLSAHVRTSEMGDSDADDDFA